VNFRALISAIILATLLPITVSAETDGQGLDPVARRVSRLANELHSPFCPGKTLLTCTSYQAIEVRREIRDLAADGKNDTQIIDILQAKYGDRFKDGRQMSNPVQPWYTIIVPFLPFVLLAFLLLWVFRRWRKPTTEENADDDADEAQPSAEDDDRLARLRARIQNDTD